MNKKICAIILGLSLTTIACVAGEKYVNTATGKYLYPEISYANLTGETVFVVDSNENQTVIIGFSDNTSKEIPVTASHSATTSLFFGRWDNSTSTEIFLWPSPDSSGSEYKWLATKSTSTIKVSGKNLGMRLYADFGKEINRSEEKAALDSLKSVLTYGDTKYAIDATQMRQVSFKGYGSALFSQFGKDEVARINDDGNETLLQSWAGIEVLPEHWHS